MMVCLLIGTLGFLIMPLWLAAPIGIGLNIGWVFKAINMINRSN